MLNQFRTLLLNLSDAGVFAEFISPGFTSRVLPVNFSVAYNTLFPNKDRNAVLLNGQAYLNLLEGANIIEAVTLIDPRVSYCSTDFDNFEMTGSALLPIYTGLNQIPNVTKGVLAAKSIVDTSKYDNLWLQHPNPIYKLAGFVASYTLRLS